MLLLASIAVNFAGTQAGTAAPVHAISMHGEPALPAGFSHFPYANADAPVGGSISHGVVGTFDSLNPFILKSMRNTARGMWDPQFGKFIFESLMTRSSDEPFALYGLLAEAVEMPEDRSRLQMKGNPMFLKIEETLINVNRIAFVQEAGDGVPGCVICFSGNDDDYLHLEETSVDQLLALLPSDLRI